MDRSTELIDNDPVIKIEDLVKEFGYKPSTPVKKGVTNFVQWYRSYFDE